MKIERRKLRGRVLERHAVLGVGARLRRRPQRHHDPGPRREARYRATRRARASSGTFCTTSRSIPTARMRCRSQAWLVTWRRAWPCPSRCRSSMSQKPAATWRRSASVEIVDPDLCGRFVARVLRGITIGSSPPWLANRLLALGMRPINSIVDASNYVMLELGQPNHTYDLAKVDGGALRVRWARDGERILTLDDVDRELTSRDGVITDATDRPVGIAGVMGGASTEIDDTTNAVLLEMAWWEPMAIARSSKRLGLRSEASMRFERGTDPELIDLAGAPIRAAGAEPVAASWSAARSTNTGQPAGAAGGRAAHRPGQRVAGYRPPDRTDRPLPRADRLRVSADRGPGRAVGSRAELPARLFERDRRHRRGGTPPRLQQDPAHAARPRSQPGR